VSRGTNGRHRRRGLLRRAAPAAASTAGGVALVTTIGTAAFWLVPGDQRVPFGGFGPGSTGAAPPTAELISPAGTTATSKPRGSSDGTVGQPGTRAYSATARAARSHQTAAGRSTSRPEVTSSTPVPTETTTTRPTTKPSLPITTSPPLVTATTTPLLLSITATVSEPDLP
jgi:hypothetical protein